MGHALTTLVREVSRCDRLGNDTDTTACVARGLAGLRDGIGAKLWVARGSARAAHASTLISRASDEEPSLRDAMSMPGVADIELEPPSREESGREIDLD